MLVNKNFINYYKENLQLTNEEFDIFIDTLQKPLPYIFRVDTPSLNYLFENNPAFTKIDYFKDIYQCDVPTYKKLPNREIFTNFILIGKLYRQELVSMIPVHFLDIKEDNSVLDMCAAPGSKSTQIIKMLKTGYLVSNDVNRKRAEILKSHINNYNKCNVMITNNDARNYPKLKFDRILCDVPCSGDGTMRKNYTLRKTWKKDNMFAMQYAILKRGLEMLNDDGTLVYSTCSFNPVENEAVIQRAVIELGCEIVKVQKIEGLKMRNGLKTWNPMVEKNENNKWIFAMETEIGLENCMRILPHDNDTGGFFVTVLKRQPKAKKSDTMTRESRTNDENTEPKNAVIENSPTDTPFYASSINFDMFYNVSEDTKILVEKQFDIKVENKMITQSIHCNQISIITDKLYDIINATKALNIISGGCKSFIVNGHKGVDTTSYRAKIGILNVLGYKHDKVYLLNDKDANLFLDNENVVNEELSFRFELTGICVVKFEKVDEYICVWVGRNTSNLLVDKHYKKAIKSIMQ